MRVSILTEQGDLHTIEVDSQMELENIKALLEADVRYLLAPLQTKKKSLFRPLFRTIKLTMHFTTLWLFLTNSAISQLRNKLSSTTRLNFRTQSPHWRATMWLLMIS